MGSVVKSEGASAALKSESDMESLAIGLVNFVGRLGSEGDRRVEGLEWIPFGMAKYLLYYGRPPSPTIQEGNPGGSGISVFHYDLS
jgi:hypothetical protein